MVRIRLATVADAEAVAAVRRASWFAAYSGIIDMAVIDRVTAPSDADQMRVRFKSRPGQKVLVAVSDEDAAVLGFASYGPEREPGGATWPPVSAAGAAGHSGELYALYVHPRWWSTGTGRELMARVLQRLTRDRYRDVTLWVLEQNARARRFYEIAGFAPDGGVNILHGLGGIPEIRYRRPLPGGTLPGGTVPGLTPPTA